MTKTSVCCALAACLIAAAAVYAAEEGTLSVKTSPDGIEVWLNDKYIGDSPIAGKKLKPGRYSLKLVDPVQHTSTAEDIFIAANEETVIEKSIQSKFGSIKVTTEPEGADVFIATSLGTTPLSNDFVIPGKYRLEVRPGKKSYKPHVEDITVLRGKTVTLNKTLEKKKVLDKKAWLRLAFGAGAIGGFGWALSEHGMYKIDPNRSGADVKRILGITLGSLCVIGLEITAFF
jgi:hypothetical protein